MAGFVEELVNRENALERVAAALSFPWELSEDLLPLQKAWGQRLSRGLFAREPFPPFSRSLRDGYALSAEDVVGATSTSPVFLTETSEVPMGSLPGFSLGPQEAALIHTGGALPVGADAVVMLEDSDKAGDLVEIRKAVQAGENILPQGEELSKGDLVIPRGTFLDYRTIGFLAALGITEVPCLSLTVGLISTGDEVIPAERGDLPPGCIRDANSWFLRAYLKGQGFTPLFFGIVGDDQQKLHSVVHEALRSCDVVVLSGGSSVSVRDHVLAITESLSTPGLIIRGLNLSPGKPTLLGGSLELQRVLIGLPGHPLSCAVVAITVLKPLLMKLIGAEEEPFDEAFFPVGADVFGKAGIEEYLPARLKEGHAFPLPAKSGFVGALVSATHLIRLPITTETVRKGEKVSLWKL
jgi:molybdopterin molybdotransferase